MNERAFVSFAYFLIEYPPPASPDQGARPAPGGTLGWLLRQKQGRIDRSDCTRTANPRPLADPGPGGAGRGRTGDPGQ